MDLKDQISDTFEEQLMKRDGDKITVKKIVDADGISRQVFYYHFQDLQAVVEYAFQRRMENTFRRCAAEDEVWKALQVILDEIWNNRVYIRKLKESRDMNWIQNILIDTITRCFKEMIEVKADGGRLTGHELNMFIELFAGGIVTMMIKRCEDKEFNSEKYAKFVERMILGKVILIEE